MNTIKKIKKRYITLAIVIIVILASVIVGKNHQSEPVSYTVALADVSDELLLAGTIDAQQRVNLGFAANGRISKNNYKVGDVVKNGSVIAEISQNNLNSNLIQAQANYTLTKAETASGVVGAELSYEKQINEQNSIVEGVYKQYLSGDLQSYFADNKDTGKIAPIISGSYNADRMGEYRIEVYQSASESGYSFRLSGLETGTYTGFVNQSGKLGESGLYIKFDINTSYNNTDWIVPVPNTRSSSYLARKTAYENARNTRTRILSEAKNSLDGITIVQGDGDISRNQAQRNQALAQINAVTTQLSDGKIIAPFDGIIARNDLEIGEIANAFVTQIVLFADIQKELNLNVPEIYINKIEIADTVDIVLDAYPDIHFTGKINFIDFINTEVDGVPVYRVEITLDDTDTRIRVGMNAKASIISEKHENVIAIPKHYISVDGDMKTVEIMIGEKIETRTIVTGLEGNNGLTEIIEGLSVGDVIIKQF